jgi:hypothetical protein
MLLASTGCVPVTVVIVNPDGTFTPSSITINSNEAVLWLGQSGGLERTDSIVRIGDPAQHPGSDPCGIADDDLDHRFDDADANELTGPGRKAVSGIFVLGPNEEGLVQKLATETCACELLQNDPCSPPPQITSVVDGNTYKLCPAEGGRNQLLDTTWNNPDVTGVTVRMNWRDLQIDNGGTIEYDWSDLDAVMDKAVEHGKLFILDVRAGKHGTPDWIFDDYAGAAGPGPVPALPTFQDWGSNARPANNCGYPLDIGDPTDASYRDLYAAMIQAMADHVASDSRWFQALARVKLSGANFLSSEARLPKRCPDEDGDGILDIVSKPNGTLDPCVCNTKVWAEAAYTPEGLYQYYRVQGNTVYNTFYGRKSLNYQLIQAGFPRVLTPINFEGDTLHDSSGAPLSADPAATTADDIGGLEQTETILQQLRDGRFTDPFGLQTDPVAGKLFVPQHSGIGRLLEDLGAPVGCTQAVSVDPLTQKAMFPIAAGVAGDSASGCPNRWAVDEGTLHSQIMGFQTQNLESIDTPAGVESALWNLTINSNGVFLEVYEQLVWEIGHSFGSGATAAVLDPNRLALVGNPAPFSKNLFTWGEELHERRRALVDTTNPHLADPFPPLHAHFFSSPLAAPETYYYVNPARCALTSSPDRVGSITVMP